MALLSRYRKTILIALKVAISGSFLAYLYFNFQVIEITKHLAIAEPIYFVACELLIFLSAVVISIRYRLFIRRIRDISITQTFRLYWAGDTFSLLSLGALGSEVYKSIFFERKIMAFCLSITDRIYSLIWSVILIAIAAVLIWLFDPSFLELNAFLVPAFCLCAFAVIASDTFIREWGYLLLTRSSDKKSVLIEYLRMSSVGTASLAKHALLSLVYFLNTEIIFYIAFQMFGLPVTAWLAVLVPLISVLVALPISIQGLGVREFVLSNYALLIGADAELAIAAALFIFAIGLIYRLIGILPLIVSNPVKNLVTR